MKVIRGDWRYVAAMDCQYGAHVFDGTKFSIYVVGWLGVPHEMLPAFTRINDDGWCGHCLLVFENVSKVDISVTTYSKVDGETIWDDPQRSLMEGRGTGEYYFSLTGSLKGFSSSVEIKVWGDDFAIHALENNEPALDFFPKN